MPHLAKILDTIVTHKRREVAQQETAVPLTILQQEPDYQRQTYSLCQALLAGTGIIAEFKRQSPSKGIINNQVSVADVTIGYMKAGASGLSILTDQQFFGGSLQDILIARPLCPIPILRKEFIVAAYQIHEAKAMGADVILLIAACLSPLQIKDFTVLAHNLGLEVLLEVHNQEELLPNLDSQADMIGVNNRNLQTFEVNLQIAAQLAPLIPASAISVAESGISSYAEVEWLKKHGYKGFLIGESFMKQANPAEGLKDFLLTTP